MSPSRSGLFTLLTQLGLSVSISIGVGIWGGMKIDRALNTNFIFTAMGTIVGVASAYYSVYTTIKSFFADSGGGGGNN